MAILARDHSYSESETPEDPPLSKSLYTGKVFQINDFQRISDYILKTIQYTNIVFMAYRLASLPMTLSDLYKGL